MNFIKNYLFLYLLLIGICAIGKHEATRQHNKTGKILIVTPTANHPEYITLQDQCFKKYLQDDYEFIIFNDARDLTMQAEIDGVCASLDIKSIHMPQDNRPEGTVYSWASYRHGQTMDYILKTIGHDYPGIMAIVDSDMFLIKEFSAVNFLEGYDIAGLSRGPEDNDSAYMWPGLLFMRMNTLPNTDTISLQPDDALGFDTGGALYHYLTANPSIKKLPFEGGRLKLDRGFQAIYVYSEPSRGHDLHCAFCLAIAEQNGVPAHTIPCAHQAQIFKELGFREKIIEMIISQEMPHECEFLLGDIFFHLGRGSGYHQLPEEIVEHNKKSTSNFMNYLLKNNTTRK